VVEELLRITPADMRENLNVSADPCIDFYNFACGTWLAKVAIPPDQPSISLSWDTTSQKVMHAMEELMTVEYPESSPFRVVNDYYRACMNIDAIEDLGAAPIQVLLDMVDRIATMSDLHFVLGKFTALGISNMVDLKVKPNIQHRTRHALFIKPAGLIQGPSVYTNPNEVQQREKLKTYYIDILMYAGYPREEAEVTAQNAIYDETQLAQYMQGAQATAPPSGKNLTWLEKTLPGIPWRVMLEMVQQECVSFDEMMCLDSVLDNELRCEPC
jgi:predicted metalloendopeptidase